MLTVVGARGGAGATTLVVALAHCLRERGRRVRVADHEINTFIDSDQFADSQPDMLLGSLPRQQATDAPLLRQSEQILLLVPSEVQAIANAVHLLAYLERFANCHLVVRSPGPTPLSPQKVQELLKVPLLATIKNDPKVALAGEHGLVANRILREPCERILNALEC